MKDNAHPHRATTVDDFLESENNISMACPNFSPDLNPVENLLDALSNAVCRRLLLPAAIRGLETGLQEKWRLLDSGLIDQLLKSMITRCVR